MASTVPSATPSRTSAVASIPFKSWLNRFSGFAATAPAKDNRVLIRAAKFTSLPSRLTGTGKSGTNWETSIAEVVASRFKAPEFIRVLASTIPSATPSRTSAVASIPLKSWLNRFSGLAATAPAKDNRVLIRAAKFTSLPRRLTGTGKSGRNWETSIAEVVASRFKAPEFIRVLASTVPSATPSRTSAVASIPLKSWLNKFSGLAAVAWAIASR